MSEREPAPGVVPSPPRLPYAPRPGQLELATTARAAFLTGDQAALEAGTGTGKTVAVLAAALEAAALQDKRVVYLTRTNSQARQVLREFRALHGEKDPPARPLAVVLQGRTNLCPKLRDDARFAGGSGEEYARICGALKRKTLQKAGRGQWGLAPAKEAVPTEDAPDDTAEDAPPDAPLGRALPIAPEGMDGCAWYGALLETRPEDLADELVQDPMDADTWRTSLERRGLCPYEAAKGLLSQAKLIVAPYIYLADPRLARAFQDWIRAPLSECLIVVDEAHNLPEYLRALHTPELGKATLARARGEAHELGDPHVRDGTTATQFIGHVDRAIDAIAEERLFDDQEDALLPSDDLVVPLLADLRASTVGLMEVIESLLRLGDKVRDAQQRRGKLPRSYLGALGSFLAAWLRHSPAEHAPVVLDGGENGPRLQLFCLDPAIGNRFLLDARAAVHISGTLRPLEQYRDLLGLPAHSVLSSWPSPFPAEHLRLILVDDVTTRYEDRHRDPAMMDRLHDHVAGLAATEGVNAAVFAPSHDLARELRTFALDGSGRQVFVEAPDLPQGQLMRAVDSFRRAGEATEEGGPGAVWLGVMGGRVAEGMDFPGATLEALALVGVPFPKPSARQRALVRFNEIRFDRGWEYAVEAPTVRKVLQAIGRVIRDADDRGVVYLMDARFRRHADHLPRLERLPDGVTVAEHLAEWCRSRPGASRDRWLVSR